MSGGFFLGVATLVCIGIFFVGRRQARLTEDPFAGKSLFGLPPSGAGSLDQQRLIGRIFMIVAPLFWLLVAAIAFGLLPAGGIAPIQF